MSAISPAQFSDERHLVGLIGKQLNACDELSFSRAIESDRFKAVISGDPVTGRDVFRSAITFRPQALNVFATNSLPNFHGGMDRGVRRRLGALGFNRVIPKCERIPQIAAKIAESESELLLAMAIRGACRLLKTGSFTEPESSRRILNDWLLGADPVAAWIDAGELKTLLKPEGKIRTRTAYQAFRNWAIEEGFSERHIPSINAFTQRVPACDDDIDKKRESGGAFFVDRTRLI